MIIPDIWVGGEGDNFSPYHRDLKMFFIKNYHNSIVILTEKTSFCLKKGSIQYDALTQNTQTQNNTALMALFCPKTSHEYGLSAQCLDIS